MTADTPAVRVGQIWADNDKRSHGRKVRIVEIVYRYIPGRPLLGRGEPHAVVELVTERGAAAGSAKPGRRTTIRLDRFRPTSTGYRLIQDVSAEETVLDWQTPNQGQGEDPQ